MDGTYTQTIFTAILQACWSLFNWDVCYSGFHYTEVPLYFIGYLSCIYFKNVCVGDFLLLYSLNTISQVVYLPDDIMGVAQTFLRYSQLSN